MSHALDCECIYCTHNHDDRCGCPTCVYIRQVYGEPRSEPTEGDVPS